MSPARYIEKVSLVTGEVLDGEIRPEELLVHDHRDYHIVDVQARRIMSRIVRTTGSEEKARDAIREWRRLGDKATDWMAKIVGRHNAEVVSSALLGLKHSEYYFRYKRLPLSNEVIAEKLQQLRQQGLAQCAKVSGNGKPALRVLLTGGTGFVGQEILWQAANDEAIVEMVVLIRPKDIVDRKTGQVIRTLSPSDRGEELLTRLWLDTPEKRAKFRFIAGDVEQPRLGVSDADYADLQHTLTHVVHCAASVSFEDPYEKSFQINVMGTTNALEFSLGLQSAAGSPFITHIGIETSYIHGRRVREKAREDEVVFPRNFYNNYYELTKAMGSIDTERFMLDKGLRVIELCPAIVIGNSRTGNNWGDTKVVNAPINLFGRAQEALANMQGNAVERFTASLLARMACIFPADPSARLNLIPVDWVAQGILAALHKPEAIGERVHLATDNRLSSQEIHDIVKEELGVDVRLAEPTLHRTVTLPVLTKLLNTMHQERISNALERLSTIFGSYSEWGQPEHEVGKDVRILGLSEPRPNTYQAFRMLCRHNRYVQQFGEVRDLGEISRREQIWEQFISDLAQETGQVVATLPAEQFHAAVERYLDVEKFVRK
jgi:nucleoside-diphosphate-sugar epimerase